MNKHSSHRKPLSWCPLICLLTGILWLTGCASNSENTNQSNRALGSLLEKKPVEMIQELSKVFRSKPSINILGSIDEEIFEYVPTFSISNGTENPQSEKVLGINLSSTYIGSIEYEFEADEQELRKKLVLLNSKSQADFDLLLCDDFLPLLPHESYLLEPNISSAIWLLDTKKLNENKSPREQRTDLSRFNSKRSTWRSPLITGSQEFMNSTFFYRPMGFKDPTEFIPISVSRMVLLYNQLAWNVYHHLNALQSPKSIAPAEIPALDEMHFRDFVQYLKRNQMIMLYPNPESSDPKVAKLGMAFVCQLINWLENSSYQAFLTFKESPKIVETMRRINQFLRENGDVLKESNDLNDMLEKSLNENILTNPPKNFVFPNFYDLKQLPSDYKIEQVDYRMTFAYLPESNYVESIANLQWKNKNKVVLAEIAKQDEEERKKREAKRMRKKKRRERRSSKDSNAVSDKSEQDSEVSVQEEETKSKYAIETNSTMLATFQLKEHIGIREYFAIPSNTLNKKESLSFAISLLQKDAQESISLNYLKKTGRKDVALIKSRRPIRLDCDPKVWISKEFLIKKKKKPPREAFETSIYLPQADAQKTFTPVLNYYYQRAILKLWKKRKI